MSNKVVKDGKELDPQMKIYLIVAPGNKLNKTIGFKALGSGEVFTFGFSSPEKLTAFVRHHQKKGKLRFLGNKILAYWVTLKEYLDNPSNNKLSIDPDKNFPIDFDMPQLN